MSASNPDISPHVPFIVILILRRVRAEAKDLNRNNRHNATL
jgi:hypothetical protein